LTTTRPKPRCLSRAELGTSNPFPSSDESGANLSLAGIRFPMSRSRGFPQVCGPGRAARSAETRRTGRGNIGPTGGNISVGPYSSIRSTIHEWAGSKGSAKWVSGTHFYGSCKFGRGVKLRMDQCFRKLQACLGRLLRSAELSAGAGQPRLHGWGRCRVDGVSFYARALRCFPRLKPPEPVQTSLTDVFESSKAGMNFGLMLRQIFDSSAGTDLGQSSSDQIFGRYVGLGGTPRLKGR
jgi:hypothetical protein